MTETRHDADLNYFNYFTEIEEHFQRARGSGLILLSPIDWALIESWKDAGVPLEAVLRGIDAAFEKWHNRKRRGPQVNSVAYCAQAVHQEAQIMAGAVPANAGRPVEAPFSLDELTAYLEKCVVKLGERPGFDEVTGELRRIQGNVVQHFEDLRDLEQRLTVLEEKMSSIAKASVSNDDMLQIRRDLDSALAPYRGKMTADQLSMLERQYLEKRVFEHAALPRLSLFYLK